MTGKILLISWTVPPEPSGSAVIVGNLAKQFTADEMIVAGERPWQRPAVAWNPHWPRLVYIAAGWPSSWRGARWWRRLQLPLILWRSVRLAKGHRCASVIAVFPNEEYFVIGYLTALWTGASFFPYFHNTWVENRKGLARRFADFMQSHVFANAKHVFVISEGMMELFRECYPRVKCSHLVHSFNEKLPEFSSPLELSSPLRIMICGNINESCRDAVGRVADAVSKVADTSLTFLSGTPQSYLAKLGLLRNGVHHETVSRDEVIFRLRQSDIVVLAHGFTGGCSVQEYRTIFPTKTIEYLICGRPILAHSPPDCYLTRFLRKHNCALIVDEPRVPALTEALQRLRNDVRLRSDLVRNALRAAEIFRAPRVAAILRAQLSGSSHVSAGREY